MDFEREPADRLQRGFAGDSNDYSTTFHIKKKDDTGGKVG
jgi:hypothetical protein